MSDPGNQNNSGTSGEGYSGQLGLNSGTSEFNAQSSLVQQILALVRNAVLVRVTSCTNNGDLASVGNLDAMPIVSMMDGLGVTSPHGDIHNLSYARVQGGTSAIVLDPKPGDIGIAVIADRDISTVKKTRAPGPPGSRRRSDLADGIYLFGVLTGAPTQYIQFLDTGINITDVSGNTIVMDSDGIKINGILFDRNQNVSAVQNLTTLGTASLGGGANAVETTAGAATKVTAT